jgi:hypothetical protein
MEDLYDCHHSGVGFVVKGCADTFSGPLPSESKKIPESVISIEVSRAFSDALRFGNIQKIRENYLVDSPHFMFKQASPSVLQRHMGSKSKFSFELPAGEIGHVNYVVGRSTEDYVHTTQGITTCEVDGQFDQRGLYVCLSGHLNLATKADIDLRSKHYRIRALIEWRVLRFLFDIYFVKAMYSNVVADPGRL